MVVPSGVDLSVPLILTNLEVLFTKSKHVTCHVHVDVFTFTFTSTCKHMLMCLHLYTIATHIGCWYDVCCSIRQIIVFRVAWQGYLHSIHASTSLVKGLDDNLAYVVRKFYSRQLLDSHIPLCTYGNGPCQASFILSSKPQWPDFAWWVTVCV